MSAASTADAPSQSPATDGDTVNIAEQLTQMAARTPDKHAVV